MVRALSPSLPPLTLPHHTITTHPLIAPSCSSTVPCHIITFTPHIPTHHTITSTPHTTCNSYYTITSTLHSLTLHHHLPSHSHAHTCITITSTPHILTSQHHLHSSHPHITPSPPLFLHSVETTSRKQGKRVMEKTLGERRVIAVRGQC